MAEKAYEPDPYIAPTRGEFRWKGKSMTDKVTSELKKVGKQIASNRFGNLIYEIDQMEYTNDAGALAQWVPSSVSATVGIDVDILATSANFVKGASSVEFTMGSAFTVGAYARRTLRPIIATGYHTTGASSASLVDSNADFITNGVQVGDTVYNTTDGSILTVTAVTSATELTGTWNAVNGTDYDFDVNDTYVVYAAGEFLDMSDYNFVGFFIHAAVKTAATDIDVRFVDSQSNTATISLPATSVNDYWDYMDVELSQFTLANSAGTTITADQYDWENVMYMDLVFGTTMGNDEVILIDEILMYQKSNGNGPVLGPTIKYISGTANLTRGVWVYPEFTSALGYVKKEDGSSASLKTLGICCTTDADVGEECEIQIDGLAICRTGASLTTPASGECLTVEDSAGTKLEAGTQTSDDCATYLGNIANETAGTDEALILVRIGKAGGKTMA